MDMDNHYSVLTIIFDHLIGHWVPMAALIALGYVGHDQKILAVTLLTLAIGFSAATYLGFQVRKIYYISFLLNILKFCRTKSKTSKCKEFLLCGGMRRTFS